MKKILFISLVVLLLAAPSFAEIGATAYSSNTQQQELCQFIYAYNNSGSSITSNQVVILDTTAANSVSGATLGARIATTTTNGDPRVIGVTDQVIANASVGRICVRGPHKVQWSTSAGPAIAGASVATGTTAGYAAAVNVTSGVSFGVMLANTQTFDAVANPNEVAIGLYWVYITQ